MRILLAIDGSPCSEAALLQVARFPWPAQSNVQVVTAEVPLEPRPVQGTAYAFDAIVKQQRAEAAKGLDQARTQLLTKAPELSVTTALLDGLPQEAIVAEAERWAADIVVVGSQGYGPIRRLFLGSVSSYVANNAPCSVMIVRPPAED